MQGNKFLKYYPIVFFITALMVTIYISAGSIDNGQEAWKIIVEGFVAMLGYATVLFLSYKRYYAHMFGITANIGESFIQYSVNNNGMSFYYI